jgi:hypothetical protein
MNYRLFIPYVNTYELLIQCLESVADLEDLTTVIDNSPDGLVLPSDLSVEVYRPVVPLGFAQSMNLIQKLALTRDLSFYLFAHSDCICQNSVHQQIITTAKEEEVRRWGAIFTLYDVFAAFNTKALNDVGTWDYESFPWYYSDNDYYRRIKLSGYEIIASPYGGVIHQNQGSNTIKNSSAREVVERMYNRAALEIYIKKWGGPPNEELFDNPTF